MERIRFKIEEIAYNTVTSSVIHSGSHPVRRHTNLCLAWSDWLGMQLRDTHEERPGETMLGMRMAWYAGMTTTPTRVITMDTWASLTLFWTNTRTFIQPLERVKDKKRLRNTRYKRWDGEGERGNNNCKIINFVLLHITTLLFHKPYILYNLICYS